MTKPKKKESCCPNCDFHSELVDLIFKHIEKVPPHDIASMLCDMIYSLGHSFAEDLHMVDATIAVAKETFLEEYKLNESNYGLNYRNKQLENETENH